MRYPLPRLPISVLRLVRSARLPWTALLLGTALSVASSAGLHREPFAAPSQHGSLESMALAAQPAAPSASHLCLVCLVHFSASLARTGVVAPVGLPPVAEILPAPSSFSGRIERHPHEDRAPPPVF